MKNCLKIEKKYKNQDSIFNNLLLILNFKIKNNYPRSFKKIRFTSI